MFNQVKRWLQLLWLEIKVSLGIGGLVKLDTLLTTRLFKPTVPASNFGSEAEWLDFLKAHPAGQFPQYWQEDESGRRRVKHRKVTDVFVAELVDTMQASVAAFSTYKYHHSGTGVGAEDQTDTALGTPRENARDVGTQVEGTTANIYKSVATTTYAAAWAITEHGLFNTAGAGGPPVTGGVLADRTVFAAINVAIGNQIEWTFQVTFAAGG